MGLYFNARSKLLSLDVESNGLHGPAFAVGAVLMSADGKVLDEFSARSEIRGEVDSWVKENVLKSLKNFPVTHKSAKAMRTAFWEWFKVAKEQADFVLVDNGYPVEARFLLQCQDDNIDERYWDHPYPLLDLAGMLLQVGEKPLTVKAKFVQDRIKDEPANRHNPRWDAWVSAHAALKALEISGQLEL
jgi:hypothetical protein